MKLDEMPPVLAEKVIRQVMIAVLILVTGLVFGIRMEDGACLVMSVLLFLYLFFTAGSLFLAVWAKEYETVEGKVTKIQRKTGIFILQEVTVTKADGNEETLVLQSNCEAKPDKAYRFYIAARAPDPMVSHKNTGRNHFRRSPDVLLGMEEMKIPDNDKPANLAAGTDKKS